MLANSVLQRRILARAAPVVSVRQTMQALTSMDHVGDSGSSSSIKWRPPKTLAVSAEVAPSGWCSLELTPPLPPLPAWRCSCCWGSCAAGSGASPSAKGLLLSAAPAAAPGLPSSTSRGDPPALLVGRDVLPGQAYGGTGCSATSINCTGMISICFDEDEIHPGSRPCSALHLSGTTWQVHC